MAERQSRFPALAAPIPTREWIWACGLVCVAAAIALHAQLAAMTAVPDYGDPLFSAWRLAWFAHQLPRAPLHLFDANIYHPAVRTLAYSDAILLPSAIAAPFLWLGAPVIVAYNVLLVASFPAAALAMFALARRVTGRFDAAILGALVFGFDPFRFTHLSHLEMQCSCWMPLALLALARALSGGRLRDGVATGAWVSLQALSSLYYGAYLAVSLVVFALGWMIRFGWPSRRVWTSIAAGGGIAALVAVVVTMPYRANRSTVGERTEAETRVYSATPGSYLTSGRGSLLYGMSLLDRRGDELNLFTGATPIVLAAAALVPPVSPLLVPSVAALAASVDGSFGLNGILYSWINRVPAFHGFRVPARFRAVVGLYLALLAGLGAARILTWLPGPRLRPVAAGVIGLVMLAECLPVLDLRPVWLHGPAIYASVPEHAVIADLPLLEDRDSVFAYLSTFHWHPLANGSSGFEPRWYPALADAEATFPSDRAIDALAGVGVQYVVMYEAYYRGRYPAVSVAADAQPRLQFLA